MAVAGENVETLGVSTDARRFGQVLRGHDQELRSVAWAVVRDRCHVDDVMQAAYEKAFRALGEFDGRSTLKTWLYSIVYRSALDHVRYEKRRRHDGIEALENVGCPTGDVATAGLARTELAAVLDELAPDERVALMLVAGLGYSYDEAAEIVGEPRGTLAARVSRARARLGRWEP